MIDCLTYHTLLRFRAGKINKTYNAARNGYVVWRQESKKLAEARLNLGLPSSCIKNTNIIKAKPFLASLDKLSLLRFILFFYAGDGTIGCFPTRAARPGQLTKQLRSMILDARDGTFLTLLKEALAPFGLGRYCNNPRKIKNHNHSRMILSFAKDKKGNQLVRDVLEAIASIPQNILHPKLKLLRDHLLNNDLCLPLYQEYSSRVSFFSYLQEDTTDSLLLVIAQ